MRILFFLAVVANSLDLVFTTLGIHGFHNREGNPLLAGLAHHQWPLFVLLKGVVVNLLIWQLYRSTRRTPTLANAGMAIVTLALVVAVGQWLGWIAGVWHVATLAKL